MSLTHLSFISLFVLLISCTDDVIDRNKSWGPARGLEVVGLSDDSKPRKSKTWLLACQDDGNFVNCTYRYKINKKSSHTFTNKDQYKKQTKVIKEDGDGRYYLHVQAKATTQLATQTATQKVSRVKSVFATLDNTSPTRLRSSQFEAPKNSSTNSFKVTVNKLTARHTVKVYVAGGSGGTSQLINTNKANNNISENTDIEDDEDNNKDDEDSNDDNNDNDDNNNNNEENAKFCTKNNQVGLGQVGSNKTSVKITVNAKPGTHDYYASVTDRAGNTSGCVQAFRHTNTNTNNRDSVASCPSTQPSPHWQFVKGKCRPSCGHAATQAGYGGSGADKKADTRDDLFTYDSKATSCKSLNKWGHDDWIEFSFQNAGEKINSRESIIVAKYGGVCCGRGTPINPVTPPTVTGLEDNNKVTAPASFRWSCDKNGCQYRYAITTSRRHIFQVAAFTGINKIIKKSISHGTVYYLHVQAAFEDRLSAIKTVRFASHNLSTGKGTGIPRIALKTPLANMSHNYLHDKPTFIISHVAQGDKVTLYRRSNTEKCSGASCCTTAHRGIKVASKVCPSGECTLSASLPSIKDRYRDSYKFYVKREYKNAQTRNRLTSLCSSQSDSSESKNTQNTQNTTTKKFVIYNRWVYKPLSMSEQYGCFLSKTGQIKCWGPDAFSGVNQCLPPGGQFEDTNRIATFDPEKFSQNVDLGCRDGSKSCASHEKYTALALSVSGLKHKPFSFCKVCSNNNCVRGQHPYCDVGRTNDRHTDGRSLPITKHICAILDDQKIKCWGQNNFGQLGQGVAGSGFVSASNLRPINLGSGLKAKAIVTGLYHSCVILEDDNNRYDDQVKCWGYNQDGQLGQGHKCHLGMTGANYPTSHSCNSTNAVIDRDVKDTPPINLSVGNIKLTVKAISAKAAHTCAVVDHKNGNLHDNKVKCWGYNGHKQYGDYANNHIGDATGELNASSSSGDGYFFHNGIKVKALSAGLYDTCVIRDDSNDDTIICRGRGLYTGIDASHAVNRGIRIFGSRPHEISFTFNKKPLSIVVGEYIGCATLNDGTVNCFGNHNFGDASVFGDLGINHLNSQKVIHFDTGSSSHCAYLSNGRVKCWGENANCIFRKQSFSSIYLFS